MLHPSSLLGSPSRTSDGSPYGSGREFEVERGSQYSQRPLVHLRRMPSWTDLDEDSLRSHLPLLLAAKSWAFSVSGLIPLDPTNLVVFFRSKSGITHSLDFPIDTDYDLPPALDVLMAACISHSDDNYPYSTVPSREPLFYPPNLPLSATLEVANHPILEAVQNTLFPTLPEGHYLNAVRDRIEIVPKGARMTPQPKSQDGRVATVIVTLPVKYRGGALVVRDIDGNEEIYHGGGKSGGHGGGVGVGHLEWTAFLDSAHYEVEEVTKGCRMTISYGVYLRTFGPAGLHPEPLITPSDRFLNLISPILNICKGRKIAFHLTGEYPGVNPAEVLAESLVPHLNGADSLMYHAMKLYKLAPELRWTAGGYIWPVDRTVECANDVETSIPMPAPRVMTGIIPNRPYRSPAMQAAMFLPGPQMNPEEIEHDDNLRWRVENSGAIPLEDAKIMLLTDDGIPITKEKVPIVSRGMLEKLVVNVLMVVYVA